MYTNTNKKEITTQIVESEQHQDNQIDRIFQNISLEPIEMTSDSPIEVVSSPSNIPVKTKKTLYLKGLKETWEFIEKFHRTYLDPNWTSDSWATILSFDMYKIDGEYHFQVRQEVWNRFLATEYPNCDVEVVVGCSGVHYPIYCYQE